MLQIKEIRKTYVTGELVQTALDGVSLNLRDNEFVAILGPSGSGKTTLLNVIGGLDRYDSGDLIINGISTKKYTDRDWDSYRNHTIGFVFQSYNLIPHQSVLANVELALTISGISRAERRRRAAKALEDVGLGNQLHKKPNQMSGGQMQRVAIARALVNDPEILLADEPTGALDSETSVQVMDLLKQIAQDRLVIMVTHNPELAEAYATRTIRLLDGNIIGDSDPYDGCADIAPSDKTGRASMSALTAFSLSLSNLMTKKGRTILTAFAGSIGIIGIALILSLSTGINNYIADVEKDTLSSYPLTLEAQTIDMSALMDTMKPSEEDLPYEDGKIYSSNVMTNMMDMMISSTTNNNLTAFKHFIESGKSGLEDLTTEIRYLYSTPLNIYKADTSNGIYQINPNTLFTEMFEGMPGMEGSASSMGSMMGNLDVWSQLTSNRDLLESQYQVLDGRLPSSWNEVVLIVDENNRITDFTLYSLGLLDVDELKQALTDTMFGKEPQLDTSIREYSFSDFLGLQFKLLPSSDYYVEENGVWVDKSEDDDHLLTMLQKAENITVVGILRPTSDASMTSYGIIGYTGELMTKLIGMVNDSAVVDAQRNNPTTDIFTNLPFADPNKVPTLEEILAQTPEESLAQLQQGIAMMQAMGMSEEDIAKKIYEAGSSKATYEGNLILMGVSDLDKPSSINLYPIDFEAKDKIADIIEQYNRQQENEDDQLVYTDMVGLMMSSITTIINAISYILIAFVGISLVVSSIMIGIITNISVLERTKEIGILRAVGASKKDISRVFNAETFIVGLAAGLVGILITELLLIPTNFLVHTVAKLDATAVLSPVATVILVAISVGLTLIAGLIPSRNAANKDPVVALRAE